MLRRALDFGGLLIVNTFLAFYLTESCVSLIKQVINRNQLSPTTLGTAITAALVESVLVAFLLGFAIYRFSRMEAGKWVWAPSLAWLLYGVVRFKLSPAESVVAPEPLWRHFFLLGQGFESVRDSSEFTIPFFSGAAYSAGCFLANRVFHLHSHEKDSKTTIKTCAL